MHAMTGGGGGRTRCKRRRKAMDGGGSTTETKLLYPEGVNSSTEIADRSSKFSNITELPLSSTVACDFFTQALKALSFRHTYPVEDWQAAPASVSSVNNLPSGLAHFLVRYSDSRNRHKKLHSGSEKKSVPGRHPGPNIWTETQDYFRELTADDIEWLHQVAVVGFSRHEKCFLIPCLKNDDSPCKQYEAVNRMLASSFPIDCLDVADSEFNTSMSMEYNYTLVDRDNIPKSIYDDITIGLAINEENNGDINETDGKNFSSLSGVEWLLGSRSKTYLASDRPSKKRKLLSRESELEKLIVALPVAVSSSVCHYCSYGDMGDPLNCLITCHSCGMMVHRRCYGVQEEIGNFWLCSWCQWKSRVSLNPERPCLLCPKQGGALKPVRKRGFVCEVEETEMEFTHLFCCQWMPEVCVENTRSMEPIMNLDEIKNSRTKLICSLCKVMWGACVRCSNGSCRTSFHPICAREARNRMEIWGKNGSDEIELRAFCSKHSEVLHGIANQNSGDTSYTADSVSRVSKRRQTVPFVSEFQKLKIRQRNEDEFSVQPETANVDLFKIDSVLDREGLADSRENSKSYLIDGNAVDGKYLNSCNFNEEVVVRNEKEDANSGAHKFKCILMKFINLGKLDVKDLALEIGVSPESLSTLLNDNHMAYDFQYKFVKWLKDHSQMGNLQNCFGTKIESLSSTNTKADVAEIASSSLDVDSHIPDMHAKLSSPRRRTRSNTKILLDEISCLSMGGRINDKTAEGDIDKDLPDGKYLEGSIGEPLTNGPQKLMDHVQNQDTSPNNSNKIEDGLFRHLAQCSPEHGLTGETSHLKRMATSLLEQINGEYVVNEYIHPFVYLKFVHTKGIIRETESSDSSHLRARELSAVEASSSSGQSCKNNSGKGTSRNWITKLNGAGHRQLARNMEKLSPQDEVEGELIYYQQRLLCHSVTKKHICDDMLINVVKSLPHEIDAAGKHRWEDVLASQYSHELRETKKLSRKECRHKEAQAVLAAAAAAAAASSRISSFRKEALEEYVQQEEKLNASDGMAGPLSHLSSRIKGTTISSIVANPSLNINSDCFQSASDIPKEHSRICDICRRSETTLNPILICFGCKVSVHLECYQCIESLTGPWYCELCTDLISQSSGALGTNGKEKPCSVTECGLCGGTAGAFRQSVDGQWIHAFCAEWVLESTYKRGQINRIQGMDTICKEVDTCVLCNLKRGVCIKCSYGHCHGTFHPTCARNAGFYMTTSVTGGEFQHKAYCEKHSIDQRTKEDSHKHGIEAVKSLKQVRVELERLRLLCERIIKREKLKRDLVLCAHGILASSRDSVLYALSRHPPYQPAVSSESATTSIQGHTDGYKSGSDILHRSDEITVDSSVFGSPVSGKRRLKISMSMDNKSALSSVSQSIHIPKPVERASFSGKQIPQRLSVTSRNLLNDVKKHAQNKQTETFEKELVMTSDQAFLKNRRLPKGFVYVPIDRLSKDNESAPDAIP